MTSVEAITATLEAHRGYQHVLSRCRRALLAVVSDEWEPLDADEVWELIHALDAVLPGVVFVRAGRYGEGE